MANEKRPRQRKVNRLAQPFDSTFKDWMRHEANQAIPYLIAGAVCEGTLDTEIIRPTMRADKVFRINLDGEAHIGNFEFQTARDEDLVSRMHVYNSVLYHDYHLPVLSMIIYPFRTTIAKSPLTITSRGKELITFHFRQLELYALEAEQYMLEQAYCMYPLLPTMQGANHKLLKQAMDELTALHGDDEATLARQYAWMQILLARTETIDEAEKERTVETMHDYDPLLEKLPKVRKIREEGKSEGRLVGTQKMFILVVSARFPNLTDLAEQMAKQITSPDNLELLAQQIVKVPDEQTARWLLTSLAA
ncbi:MAG TPA: hypothetical protein VNG51_08070 [Ktedonobacteraceae bacterium]|nr:hypothetical protein [Ktedonobacteraceae bacterium]